MPPGGAREWRGVGRSARACPGPFPPSPRPTPPPRAMRRLPRRLRQANKASAGHTKITASGTITKGAVTGTIQVMCRLTIRQYQSTRCRTWTWISSTASSRNPEATPRRNATPRNVRVSGLVWPSQAGVRTLPAQPLCFSEPGPTGSGVDETPTSGGNSPIRTRCDVIPDAWSRPSWDGDELDHRLYPGDWASRREHSFRAWTSGSSRRLK